ncbi:hypothetical protein LX36DRAFT_653240 [Colletotrichum falcatum]|nr:hypothetical protein LX36DRAFT_653240 [Colletotrichum falcatum]
MYFFNTSLLLVAMASASLVSAGNDVCPGTYCTVGVRCEHTPNGPHCCSASSSRDVLECEAGKWAIRNVCNHDQYCMCSSHGDLVCRDRDKALLKA